MSDSPQKVAPKNTPDQSHVDEGESISVKVVYALPDKQFIKELTLNTGATVQEAIELSALTDELEGLLIDPKMVGIFGSKVPMSQVLQESDRVEIYRPLTADPKEVRRQRAIRQAQSEQ